MDHSFSGVYKRVTIRPLTAETSEQLRLLRNKPHIRKWFLHSDEISQEAQEIWFRDYISNPKEFMFAAFLTSDPKRFIGSIGYYNYDPEKKTIEAGRKMIDSENTTERGLGLEMSCCGLKTIYNNLPVETVYAEIQEDNKRQLSILRIGYKITGEIIRNGKKLITISNTRNNFAEALEALAYE